MPPRGLAIITRYWLDTSGLFALNLALRLYRNEGIITSPRSDATPPKTDRNAEIRDLYIKGKSISDLAREFGISKQRVHQIVHGEG